jgi:hypothetical protein
MPNLSVQTGDVLICTKDVVNQIQKRNQATAGKEYEVLGFNQWGNPVLSNDLPPRYAKATEYTEDFLYTHFKKK